MPNIVFKMAHEGKNASMAIKFIGQKWNQIRSCQIRTILQGVAYLENTRYIKCLNVWKKSLCTVVHIFLVSFSPLCGNI